MSSTKISHFLLLPFPAWGRNCQLFLITHLTYPIGHIRPLGVLATRLVREQENVVVTFMVAPSVLDKTRNEISRQIFDEPLEVSKAFQRIR